MKRPSFFFFLFLFPPTISSSSSSHSAPFLFLPASRFYPTVAGSSCRLLAERKFNERTPRGLLRHWEKKPTFHRVEGHATRIQRHAWVSLIQTITDGGCTRGCHCSSSLSVNELAAWLTWCDEGFNWRDEGLSLRREGRWNDKSGNNLEIFLSVWILRDWGTYIVSVPLENTMLLFLSRCVALIVVSHWTLASRVSLRKCKDNAKNNKRVRSTYVSLRKLRKLRDHISQYDEIVSQFERDLPCVIINYKLQMTQDTDNRGERKNQSWLTLGFLVFAEFPRTPDRRGSVAPAVGGPLDRTDGHEAGPRVEASRAAGPKAGRLHRLFALRALPSDAFAGVERGRGRGCGNRVPAATPAATAATTVAWKAAEQHGELTNNGGGSSGPGGHARALRRSEQGPQDRTARITSRTQAGSGLQEAHQTVTLRTLCSWFLRRLRLVLRVAYSLSGRSTTNEQFHMQYLGKKERKKNDSVSEAKFAICYVIVLTYLLTYSRTYSRSTILGRVQV